MFNHPSCADLEFKLNSIYNERVMWLATIGNDRMELWGRRGSCHTTVTVGTDSQMMMSVYHHWQFVRKSLVGFPGPLQMLHVLHFCTHRFWQNNGINTKGNMTLSISLNAWNFMISADLCKFWTLRLAFQRVCLADDTALWAFGPMLD